MTRPAFDRLPTLLHTANDALNRGDRETAIEAVRDFLDVAGQPAFWSDPRSWTLALGAASLLRTVAPEACAALLHQALGTITDDRGGTLQARLTLEFALTLAELQEFSGAIDAFGGCYHAIVDDGDAATIAEMLFVGGTCLARVGRDLEGADSVRQAHDIVQKHLPPEHSLTLAVTIARINAEIETRQFETAERMIAKLVPRAELEVDAESRCTLLNLQARLDWLRGRHTEARRRFEEAAQLAEATWGSTHRVAITALTNLSAFLAQIGESRRAEGVIEAALERLDASDAPDARLAASVEFALVMVTEALGDERLALARMRQSVDRVRATHGPTHPYYGQALARHARLLLSAGDRDRALSAAETAARVLDGRWEQMNPVNVMGMVYSAERRWEDAGAAFARALDISAAHDAADHPETIAVRVNLAAAACRTGHHSLALSQRDHARTLLERTERSETEWVNALIAFAYIAARSGDHRSAEADATEAVSRIAAVLPSMLSGTSRHRRWAFLRSLADPRDIIFTLCLEYRLDIPRLAVQMVLMLKGRFIDLVRSEFEVLRYDDRPDVGRYRDELARLDDTLVNLWFQDHRQDEVLRVLGERDAVSRLLSDVSGHHLEADIDLEEVQAAVDSLGLPLVDYVQYRSHDTGALRYAACVWQPQSPPRWVSLSTDAGTLNTRATALRDALSAPESADVVDDLARALYDDLIAPLALPPEGSLLVAPDGALCLLPFAVLIDGRGNRLLDRYTLSSLTSMRDICALADSARASEPGSPPALFGDPTEHDAIGLFEVPAVARLLGACRTYYREAVTAETFAALKGPAILHVATHGRFTDEAAAVLAVTPEEGPLFQASIDLFDPEEPTRARRMTAFEMMRLDLHGCRLAVLSACETAHGRTEAGNGVYSMQRALLISGARAQLVTLWPVANRPETTESLIIEFYRHLTRGVGAADALRLAQRTLSHLPPHDWAAFVLSGDPRSIVLGQ